MQARARAAYVPQARRNALFDLEHEEDLLLQINMYGKPCARWRQSRTGYTLLHAAISNGWPIVCRRLIADFGADINASDNVFQRRCIHWAVTCAWPRLDIVQMLHEAGANLNDVSLSSKRTSLMYLLKKRPLTHEDIEIIRWMLTQESVDLAGPWDKPGETVLDIARLEEQCRYYGVDTLILVEIHRRANL